MTDPSEAARALRAIPSEKRTEAVKGNLEAGRGERWTEENREKSREKMRQAQRARREREKREKREKEAGK